MADAEVESAREPVVPPFDIPYYLDSSRWTERPPENLLETIHMDEALLPTPDEWEKYFFWALTVVGLPKDEVAKVKAKRPWKRTVTVRLCMFLHFLRIGIPLAELREGSLGTKKSWAASGRKVYRKAACLLVPVVDGAVDWWCSAAPLPSIAGCSSKRTSHVLQTYPSDEKEVSHRTAIVEDMRAKFEKGYREVWASRQAISAVLERSNASLALLQSKEEKMKPYGDHVDQTRVAAFKERLDDLHVKAELLRSDEVDAGRALAITAKELGDEETELFAAANAWHQELLARLAEEERLRKAEEERLRAEEEKRKAEEERLRLEEEQRQRELEEARLLLEEELRQQREAEEAEAARIAEEEAKKAAEEEEERSRQEEEEARQKKEEEEQRRREEEGEQEGSEEGPQEVEAHVDEQQHDKSPESADGEAAAPETNPEAEDESKEEQEEENEEREEKTEEPQRGGLLSNFWRAPVSKKKEEEAKPAAEEAKDPAKKASLFSSLFGAAAREEEAREETSAATPATAGLVLTPAAQKLREELRQSLLDNPVRPTGELVCDVMEAVERFTAERLVMVASALELDEEQVVDVLQANQQIADRNKRRLQRLAAAGRKAAAAAAAAKQKPVTEEISQSLEASGLF